MTAMDVSSASRPQTWRQRLPRVVAARRAARGFAELWAFALVALPVVAGAAAVIVHLGDAERMRASDRLRVVAQVKASSIARWIDGRRQDARDLLADESLLRAAEAWRRDPGEPQRRQLLARLRSVMLAGRYADVVLCAPGGAPAWSADLDRTVQVDAAFVSALHGAADTGLLADTGLYTESHPQQPLARFDVLLPLPGPAGEPLVIGLRTDPSRMLLPLAREWPGAERTARTSIFRREGDRLRFFDEPAAAQSTAPADVVRPDREPGIAARGPDLLGVPVVAVAAAVPGTDLFVAAQVPQAALDEAVSRHALWVLAVDGSLLVLACVGTVYVSQRRALRLAQRHAGELEEKMRALRLLDDIAGSSPDAIYARDREGRYLFVNAAACRMLGRPAEEVVGRTVHEIHPSVDAQEIARTDAEVIASGRAIDDEMTTSAAAGARTYGFTKGPLHDGRGRPAGVCGVSRDVTERKRAEGERRLWAMAFESTRDGVMITDATGRISAVNRAFAKITGYEHEMAVGRTPVLLRSGRHGPDFYRDMWRDLRSSGHWQGEIWNRRRDGEVFPELLTISAVRDDGGAVVNYVGVFTDLSLLRQSEARLEQLERYDPLTNLANRRLIQRGLESAIARAARHGGSIAALYIDLDRFSTVNDSLGHPVGDELLQSVANRLALRVRESDQLGRLGGDEFLLVAEDLAHAGDIASLARDLLRAIAEPIALANGREAYVTASIGISLFPADGSRDAVEMLRDADAATQRAKDLGRNRFCFYTSDLNADAIARLDLEAALSRAIARGELLLHYQPKVDARSGALAGVEALLRWQQGEVLVPPGEFIPVAERSSLILEIGDWVVDRACAQLREWLDAGADAPKVAVNVASRQVARGDLDVVVADALERHRVPASLLEIELTESMLMEQPEETVRLLDRIRELGVTLSLDDFGTGFSSLRYLQRFPIQALKIDQSFVREIGASATGCVIVDAVIDLARRLDLAVIAEGVETPAQREYLVARGCDRLQGYLFGRPMAAQALQAWITRDAQAEAA